MKSTLIAIIVAVASMLSPVQAGTSQAVVPVGVETSSLDSTFKLFAASIIEDTDSYAIGGGVSLEVPVFHDLKLEIVGSVFEEELYTLGVNALYYVPLNDALSVYVIGGGSYEFETEQWAVGAGAGVKYSLSAQLSLFADGVYNWTVEDSQENGVTVVRVGVGFSF